MKKSIQITLKDRTRIQFETKFQTTSDTFIKVHELHYGTSPLFLEIDHHQINTLLELSKVSPFVLLLFDEKLEFSGASYSINYGNGSFGINTQAKRILFLHHSINVKLEEVLLINLNL
jgi:hypothetical protein